MNSSLVYGLKAPVIGNNKLISLKDLNVSLIGQEKSGQYRVTTPTESVSVSDAFTTLGKNTSQPLLLSSNDEIALGVVDKSGYGIEILSKEKVLEGVSCPDATTSCTPIIESISISNDWAVATIADSRDIYRRKITNRFYRIGVDSNGNAKLVSVSIDCRTKDSPSCSMIGTPWTVRGVYGRTVKAGGKIVVVGMPSFFESEDSKFQVLVLDASGQNLVYSASLPLFSGSTGFLSNVTILGVQESKLFFASGTLGNMREVRVLETKDMGLSWNMEVIFYSKVTGCNGSLGSIVQAYSRYIVTDVCWNGPVVSIVENGVSLVNLTNVNWRWTSLYDAPVVKGDFIISRGGEVWYLPHLISSRFSPK